MAGMRHLFLLALSCQADIIFLDGFERLTLGPNWSSGSSGAAITLLQSFSGLNSLWTAAPTGWAYADVGVGVTSDINIEFAMLALGLGSAHTCKMRYRVDSGSWTDGVVLTSANVNSWVQSDVDVGLVRSRVEIKFVIDGSITGGCYADSVAVYANTLTPTAAPSVAPSLPPSSTRMPSKAPTQTPSTSPTTVPSSVPTKSPTSAPTNTPTIAPAITPTLSDVPSVSPSTSPNTVPSSAPTKSPTLAPTNTPTNTPTIAPTITPTLAPSVSPSLIPSASPSVSPTTSSVISIPPSLVPSVLSVSISPSSVSVPPSFVPSIEVPPSVSISPSVLPRVLSSVLPTMAPNVVPSSTPVIVPTLVSSPAPSVSSNPTPTQVGTTTLAYPCLLCHIPVCGLLFPMERRRCADLQWVTELTQWGKDPDCTAAIRNVVCSFVSHEQAKDDCLGEVTPCLAVTSAVYACTHRTLRPRLHERCEPQTSGWVGYDAEQSAFEETTWNSTLNLTYTEQVRVDPCFESVTYANGVHDEFLELGPLADVKANPEKYPDMPPVVSVPLDNGSGEALFSTGCLPHKPIKAGWVGFLVAYLLCMFVTGCWAFARKDLQPFRARSPLLLLSCVLWATLNVVLVSIDEISRQSAPCVLMSVSNMIAWPMLLVTYVLRSLRLLFLYRWSESKLTLGVKDWYFDHRYLVSNRFFVAFLGANLVLYSVLFSVAQSLDGTFAQTRLDSGRCNWWHVNDEMIEAANARGISLQPNSYAVNGLAPYSLDYSSCVFCTSLTTQTLIFVDTSVLVAVLMVALFMVRKVADQYKLWLELVTVIVLLIGVCCVRNILLFPAVSHQFGLDLELRSILLAVLLCLCLVFSLLLPLFLTYTPCYVETSYPCNSLVSISERKTRLFSAPHRSSSSASASATPSRTHTRMHTRGHSLQARGSMVPSRTRSTRGHSQQRASIWGQRQSLGKDKRREDNGELVMVAGELVGLDDVLDDEVARQLFKQFAIESFVVENLAYILEIREYDDMLISTASPAACETKAIEIFYKYVAAGSPLELNISSSLRRSLTTAFTQLIIDSDDVDPKQGSITVTPAGLAKRKLDEQNLLSSWETDYTPSPSRRGSMSFCPSGSSSRTTSLSGMDFGSMQAKPRFDKVRFDEVTLQVRKHMLRNSWARFTKSKHFQSLCLHRGKHHKRNSSVSRVLALRSPASQILSKRGLHQDKTEMTPPSSVSSSRSGSFLRPALASSPHTSAAATV